MSFFSAHASLVVACIFAVLAIAAAAFAAWPAWKGRGTAPLPHALLAAAIGFFVIGIGAGSYLLLGQPELARRSFAAPDANDVPGLIAALSRRLRGRPGDLTGWTLLGRGYMSLNDPTQAAVAFRHATALASPAQRPALLSAYGEALTLAAGSVTPEAEAAFVAALAGNPKDEAARFYLGEAYAARRQPERALSLWRSLLAESPPNAPWREELLARMAMLSSQTGAAPDIGAMVSGLAARLKVHPDDIDGWERLIRAYSVLGENDRATTALADAQAAMKRQPKALISLEAEAKSLGLRK